MEPGHADHRFGTTSDVAKISAQARATSESAVVLPGIVAKPLFSINDPRSQLLALTKAVRTTASP
ncbi:MAG: hypothetical protein OJF58_001116 [Enhydrobacter sp.]|nr:MAG: hypothetical protein OJF58_001116 [Enhydrobacter sp.]